MKVPASINLDLEVRSILDRVAEREDRSRSWAVNHAVREWAADRGLCAAGTDSSPAERAAPAAD